MSGHVKLFIPGPTEVSEKTFRAFCTPMIGHRGSDFKALYGEIQPKLQNLFGTKRPVFLSTSSAWGIMEGAIRNLVPIGGKVLCCMCGAFSDKWFDVSRRCGREAIGLQVEWGKPILPDEVQKVLSSDNFDAMTLIHNETSCGLRNPLWDIAEVMKKFPKVMFIVDTVSSFSTQWIPMDELGIDVMLTGSQKALALPPGLALFAVSERAMERATKVEGRGYYFDFLEFAKNAEQNMTPSTPSISHIFALRSKLEEIENEGLEKRFQRHSKTNALVHEWVKQNGFGFFAQEGYRSVSLTCVENTRGIDVAAWVKRL
ncbi:MAG: alanine--glyoxylate aminotransferase family protein, partial [Chthoniobacterales bacterium]|nr:alanine--glyoxylate aminotransferase family protein [Chthoniobacterales bacterium]